MTLFGFRRHKNRYLPGGRRERHDLVMRVHREVSGNDDVRNMNTINLLLEQIEGEKDPFILDSYVLYYIGFYKPFADGNEETAKTIADGILADSGWEIPQEPACFSHLGEVFANRHDIESVAEWQRRNARRR